MNKELLKELLGEILWCAVGGISVVIFLITLLWLVNRICT